jgi:hypothetical protein
MKRCETGLHRVPERILMRTPPWGVDRMLCIQDSNEKSTARDSTQGYSWNLSERFVYVAPLCLRIVLLSHTSIALNCLLPLPSWNRMIRVLSMR